MTDLPQNVPAELAHARNRRVLEHIAEKFAHSDLSEVLRAAVKPLGDVHLYCPDWPRYRYVVASTRQVIFGFAIGTNTIAFRLAPAFVERALATGGAAFPACGDDWVTFMPFRDDWPRIDVRFWAEKAYAFAREIGG